MSEVIVEQKPNGTSNGSIKSPDYYWAEDREPHFQRRKDILKDHPAVKDLIGVNPWMKYTVVFLVTLQLGIAAFSSQLGWIPFLLIAYFIGASVGQALFLAIHEITHYLAFKSKKYNNYLAFIANLPIVIPYAMSFKVYHGEHHWDQGRDTVDTDIASTFESKVFKGFVGKLVWYLFQIVFYAFRPILVRPIKIDKWQVYNFVFQVACMVGYYFLVTHYFGFEAYLNAIFYLLLSLLLAGGLHPTAGHFISEHYVFEEGQETYSYYGPLNKITFNVGYHNEHHDFPNIPGSQLPKLRKLAPEYYDGLKSYDSWVKVIWGFIFNKDITLYSRTKRKMD